MDQTLFHLINGQWTGPALDLFMAVLSDSEIWNPFLIAIVLGALFFGGFKARAFMVCLLLSLLIGELFTSALKSAIDRRRPKQVQDVRMVELQKARPKFMTLFKKPTIRFSGQSDRNRSGPSFPSGHVTNNAIIAVYLTLFYPRRGWLYWIVAAAVGYSRIYLGAHWPSDVIATLFLATGEALVLLGLFELIWRTVARRWAPGVYARHPSLISTGRRISAFPSPDSEVGSSRHIS
ncbi:MAG TPA: phosphatase PAP2 family protein [Candidatus Sulfotelmatobacter sp.]|jgi:undecaprenyl-diphosphatase|nr:phosphatase PAP2 family protein [Candidatus Sulfotelmatobacter sp.]